MVPWWAELLVSLGATLLVVWALFVFMLWRSGPGVGGLADAARLLPDLLRLIARLARDPSLPRGVRVRLWLLLAYLASPVDLVPDFVPVAGYADDAIIVALVLRSVVRAAGSAPLDRYWSGSAEGLAVVRRLAGLPDPSVTPDTSARPDEGADGGWDRGRKRPQRPLR